MDLTVLQLRFLNQLYELLETFENRLKIEITRAKPP